MDFFGVDLGEDMTWGVRSHLVEQSFLESSGHQEKWKLVIDGEYFKMCVFKSFSAL